jgi:hypothetical protein
MLRREALERLLDAALPVIMRALTSDATPADERLRLAEAVFKAAGYPLRLDAGPGEAERDLLRRIRDLQADDAER